MAINYKKINQNNPSLKPVGNTATVPTPENIGINGAAAADGVYDDNSNSEGVVTAPATPSVGGSTGTGGYGSWLSGLWGAASSAVGSAISSVHQAASGAVDTVSGIYNGIRDGVSDTVNGIRDGVRDAITNAQNLLPGGPESVEGAHGDLTTPSQNGQSGTPAPTTPTPEPAPEVTPTPEPTPTPSQNGQSGTPAPTTPTPEQAPSATAPDVSGGNSQTTGNTGESVHIPTYEEFLASKEGTYKDIYDKQTAFYDKQAKDTLAALDEQKTAADTHAKDTYDKTGAAITEQKTTADAQALAQRDMLIGMSEEQRQAVYDFAEAQGIADKNYAAAAYKKLVDAINAERTSGQTMAAEQRDLLLNMSASEREAAYKYAEEQRASADKYHSEVYQNLVKALGSQKTSGEAMAKEQRDLLLNMSEEQRQAAYAAAERQRAEAETNADVERKRAIADSYSAYLQNQAGYGANAEALGRMGITGGGYSDYLNNAAYATQRAEAQSARAQSDAAKRSARYTEDMTKLEADSKYNDRKYAAESEYSDKMYDIDTSYRTNMLNAEQDKLSADYETSASEREAKRQADSAHSENEYNAKAQYGQNMYDIDTTYRTNMLGAEQDKLKADYEADTNERTRKQEADSAHAENKYTAESSYSDMLYQNDSAEREQKLENDLTYSEQLYQNEAAHKAGTLEANQTADAGKFGAEMAYAENLMNNKGELAAYREEKQAEADAKAEAMTENARSVYTELLGYANNGTYSAEQLERLCDEYGLTPEQRQSLLDARAGYDTKTAEDEAKGQSGNFANLMAQSGDYVGYVDAAVAAGSISAEQGNQYLYSQYRNDAYYGDVDTRAVDKLVEAGRVKPEQKEELVAIYNDGVDTSANNFKNDDGELISKDEAVDLIARAKKDTWITSDTINALIDTYEKLYPDGDIIPRGDDLPPEAIEDTTGKHIGTSTLTESTEDAVGKLFDNSGPGAESKFLLPNGQHMSIAQATDYVSDVYETLSPEAQSALIAAFDKLYPNVPQRYKKIVDKLCGRG